MQEAVRRFEAEMQTVLVAQWRGCSWEVTELQGARREACAPLQARGCVLAPCADDGAAPQPAGVPPASHKEAAARDDDDLVPGAERG